MFQQNKQCCVGSVGITVIYPMYGWNIAALAEVYPSAQCFPVYCCIPCNTDPKCNSMWFCIFVDRNRMTTNPADAKTYFLKSINVCVCVWVWVNACVCVSVSIRVYGCFHVRMCVTHYSNLFKFFHSEDSGTAKPLLYLWVCDCNWLCVCVCLSVHICILCVCMCVCLCCVCEAVCVCVCKFVCLSMCIFACVCVCFGVRVCVCGQPLMIIMVKLQFHA